MAGIPLKSRENAGVWMIKIFAGALILFFLVLHFVVNHFLGPEEGLLNYQAVVAYYKNPIIPIIEILFLVTVLVHCLIGVRSILLDLNPSERALKIIDWVLILSGAGASLYGIWLVIVIVGR